MIYRKPKQNSGFMALMSAIIISVVLLLLVTNLSLTGFYDRSNILDGELKERSSALAEACVDTAILKLANDPTYSPTNEDVFIGSDKCVINSISSGTIYVRADYKNYITKLEVDVDSSLSVTRWEEVL